MLTELVGNPTDHSLPRRTLFNTPVTAGTYADILNAIISLAAERKASYICFANAHMLMEAYDDLSFNRILRGADIVAPDGKPVALMMRLRHGQKQERVCGMDILPDVLRSADLRRLSVFFLGSTNAVLDAVVKAAKENFPTLHIAGTYSPPFEPFVKRDETAVSLIRQAKPHLVFVSLGCPKQEKWMALHRDDIGSCMLGVGQAFLTFAGLEKRLPKWARGLALEWAYRLYLEPRRLWRRYLVTNSKFLWQSLRSITVGSEK